jgi:hypothetical protein
VNALQWALIGGALTSIVWALFWALIGIEKRPKKTAPPFIDLNSKCPACGWPGCTLKYRSASVAFGDDGKAKLVTAPPEVIRICNTCGAEASQKTVLDPKEWIAK